MSLSHPGCVQDLEGTAVLRVSVCSSYHHQEKALDNLLTKM